MEYDLEAALPKFVERMTRAVKVGLQAQKLQEVIERAAREIPGITRETAEFWIVPAKDGDGRGLAVNLKGSPRAFVAVIPINSQNFGETDLASLSVTYQMMDPRYSID